MNINITIIKKCLQKEFGCDKIAVTDGSVYAQNEHIIALAVLLPHEGNNYHYLIRFSTVAGFDRWANSRAIEKEFDTVMEIVQYLKENKLEIYKKLFEYLSRKYEYIQEEFDDELTIFV